MNFKSKYNLLRLVGIIQILVLLLGGYYFLTYMNKSMTKNNIREFNIQQEIKEKKFINKSLDIIIVEDNKINKKIPTLVELKNGEIIDDYFNDYQYIAKNCKIFNKKGSKLFVYINSNSLSNIDYFLSNINKPKSDYQIKLILYK